MNRLFLALFLLVLPAYGLEEAIFLQAIAIRENSLVMGKAGELGPHQMGRQAVRDAGGYDLSAATRHLHWLTRTLQSKGVPASVFNLGVCWNAGLERYTTGRAKDISYRYGQDVQKIYNSIIAARDHDLRQPIEPHFRIPPDGIERVWVGNHRFGIGPGMFNLDTGKRTLVAGRF